MTKANVRNLVKSVISDVTTRYTVSDTDIDLMVRKVSFDIADLLCKYEHEYFKKSYIFAIDNNALTPITGTTMPITESIKSLIYSYLTSDVNYPLTITTVEGVNQADMSNSTTGYIGYSKTNLFIHLPYGITSGTLYVTFYTNPDDPVDDNAEIDIPVEYLNHLVYSVKQMIYLRYDYPIPRWLELELNKAELKIRG